MLGWPDLLDCIGGPPIRTHALKLARSGWGSKMAEEVGGESSPNRSEAFDRLVTNHAKRTGKRELPKFVKRIEDVPEVALPLEETIRVALSLADRALIGQFTGLWPSPKTTDS